MDPSSVPRRIFKGIGYTPKDSDYNFLPRMSVPTSAVGPLMLLGSLSAAS
jgi:hypothetical protein